MEVLGSECSSGCESGWTLYLEEEEEHSNFISPDRNPKFGCEEYDDDDEEEDLSMVSDASSGPPQFHEDDEAYFHGFNGQQYSASKATTTTLPNNGVKKQKRKDHRRCRGGGEKQELPSFLDDTASSPVINISSKNNQASMESVLDYSQASSATYLQGRSAFQDHFGFLQSSVSGNHLQNNQGGCEVDSPILSNPAFAAIDEVGVEVALRESCKSEKRNGSQRGSSDTSVDMQWKTTLERKLEK